MVSLTMQTAFGKLPFGRTKALSDRMTQRRMRQLYSFSMSKSTIGRWRRMLFPTRRRGKRVLLTRTHRENRLLLCRWLSDRPEVFFSLASGDEKLFVVDTAGNRPTVSLLSPDDPERYGATRGRNATKLMAFALVTRRDGGFISWVPYGSDGSVVGNYFEAFSRTRILPFMDAHPHLRLQLDNALPHRDGSEALMGCQRSSLMLHRARAFGRK
jgi:hypothetical protein